MRRELLLALSILAAQAAYADFTGSPVFTVEETETITETNELGVLLHNDPWLLRLVFDMAERPADFPDPPGAAPNPEPGARDPLGIVNWNEIIRKAKQRKEQGSANEVDKTSRSSLGIVDTNNLMRQAKAKKESGGAP